MLVRRMQSAYPLGVFENSLENLASQIWDGWFNGSSFSAYPALAVWEDQDRIYAEAELPGMKMEDLEIVVAHNTLNIKGERKDLKEEGKVYYSRERSLGAFTRSIQLPVDVDAEKAEATLRDGVLTIALPKAERAKARKIEIKAA